MCCQLSRLLPETAVIEKVKEYNLWVGDVRVTNRNKNDIMNDGGKVKFDPETGTLTLDDPEIIGKYKFSMIYTEIDLTLKGSYHMPVDVYETNCAVRVDAEKDLTLTLDGNDMVNNRDSVILDRYIANWVGYDTRITNMKAADLNRDGVVNNRDAIILDRYVAVWDGYDKYIIKV